MPTGEQLPMRNHCCSVDPTADDCMSVDCSMPSTGMCVQIPACSEEDEDNGYYFDEFKGRCEWKETCP